VLTAYRAPPLYHRFEFLFTAGVVVVAALLTASNRDGRRASLAAE
jgi:hypothetical protein